MIGKGSFGSVYTGLNCDTGELLAVKEFCFSGTVEVIKEVWNTSGQRCLIQSLGCAHSGVRDCPSPSPSSLCSAQQLAQLQREITILQQLNHENIVRYRGTEREGCILRVFLEFISGGSITAIIKQFGVLPESVIVR